MSNLKKNLDLLLANIEKTARDACRDPSSITLLPVSKYASVSQIKEAYDLGIRSFAESKIQDALEKKELLPKDIQWHFIGRIQSNKINKILSQFTLIHSVADAFTAKALSDRSLKLGVKQSILLQVNSSLDESKQGFSLKELEDEWNILSSFPGISLEGLMTMGPNTDDREKIQQCFASVAKLKDTLNERGGHLHHLSMGMSGDYDLAIKEGSTLIRIGSALFS